jgi:transcriptional regulator with XRE-family HTH domain
VKRQPDSTDKHVGTRIRMGRLALEMSQSKLADALGITFQQVQKYESGTNRVSAGRLQQMADALQVPVTFFFDGDAVRQPKAKRATKAPIPAFVTDFLAAPDGLALAKSFMRIKSPKLRRRITHLAANFASRQSP